MHSKNSFSNSIIYGDCIDIMSALPSESIDLVVTDPPYLVGYRDRKGRTIANDRNSQWLKPAFREIYRVLKPDSYCISFYGWNQVERFMYAWKDAGLRPVGHFVWTKNYASSAKFTQAHHECAYLLAKGEPEKPDNPPRDIQPWHYTGNILHPTQKPVHALSRLIEAYSHEGDVVLDPFAGSGTTAVAARRTGRNYIAIEKDWNYYRAARTRLQAESRE